MAPIRERDNELLDEAICQIRTALTEEQLREIAAELEEMDEDDDSEDSTV